MLNELTCELKIIKVAENKLKEELEIKDDENDKLRADCSKEETNKMREDILVLKNSMKLDLAQTLASKDEEISATKRKLDKLLDAEKKFNDEQAVKNT